MTLARPKSKRRSDDVDEITWSKGSTRTKTITTSRMNSGTTEDESLTARSNGDPNTEDRLCHGMPPRDISPIGLRVSCLTCARPIASAGFLCYRCALVTADNGEELRDVLI